MADPGHLKYPLAMADGFTLRIDHQLAEDLERRARAAGVTREELALRLLQQDVINYDDYDWDGEDPRAAIAELEAETVEEESRPWPEAKAELLQYLDEQLNKKP
jgi:hypothetical protein